MFARHLLPQPIDGSYVINTDPNDKPGEHWVAAYIKGGRGEYYDPLGLPPLHKDIMNFLPKKWTYNDKTVQNIVSYYCGHHCTYYLINRRRYTIHKIVSIFTDDNVKKDILVKEGIVRFFNKLLK